MEYRIIKNEEHNGLEIYFDEKPSEEIRSALKEIKFRWHGMKKCWYGRAELSTVENILGVKVADVKTEKEEILKTCYTKEVEAYLGGSGYEGSNSGVSSSELTVKIREIMKACGIKGVTVSKKWAGYTPHVTIKFRLASGDVRPFEDCKNDLMNLNTNRYLTSGWVKDPDNAEGIEVPSSKFFDWSGEKQQRALELWASKKYESYTEGYPFSICHGWQLKREEAPMFTAQFFDRWEAMTKIVNSFNYNKSNSMVDYFDVGFYEDWEILPEKKAA